MILYFFFDLTKWKRSLRFCIFASPWQFCENMNISSDITNINRYSILHRHTGPTCMRALSKGIFILNYLADSSDIIHVYLRISRYRKVISKRKKEGKREQKVSLPEEISFSGWSILYPKYVASGKPMGKWHWLHRLKSFQPSVCGYTLNLFPICVCSPTECIQSASAHAKLR